MKKVLFLLVAFFFLVGPVNAAYDKQCFYTSDGKSLLYEGKDNDCTITYNDSTNEMHNQVCRQIYTEPNCPDLVYNPKNGEIRVVTYNFNEWTTPGAHPNQDLYRFVCEGDKPEYFCSGACKYPENRNVNCLSINNELSKNNNDLIGSMCSDKNILKALRFVGVILMVVKILIPIILIIMGSIDFGKAIFESDSNSITKATSKLVTRIIAGVLIFLLPTVVNFIFNILIEKSGSNFSEFRNCNTCIFHVTNCPVEK